MTIAETATAFRRLHEGPGAFVMPNPWDIGTARILAGLGYQALATTSAGLAYSLGRRDGQAAVTRDEALEHAAVIVGGHGPAGQRRPRERLRSRSGERRGDHPRRRGGRLVFGLLDRGLDVGAGRARSIPLSQAVERITAAVEAAAALPFTFTLTARAPRTTCTGAAIWTGR